MRLCLFDPGISPHSGTPAENLGNMTIQQAVLSAATRTDIDGIQRWVLNPEPFRLNLPKDAIAAWRGQFLGNDKVAAR